MKKFCLLIAFLFINISIFAQYNQTIPNGYNIFRYGNGQISSEGMMKDSKPEGFWKTFYPSGIKKSEGNRRNSLLDSIWVFYNENGDTTQKISYFEGKKNGYTFTFAQKKDSVTKKTINYVSAKELFLNDKKNGKSFYFYPDGQVHKIFNFRDDKKHGIGKEYDKKGNIITIFSYRYDNLLDKQNINRRNKQGRKQGWWKEFYPEEKVKTEAFYNNDTLNGYYKEFDIRGELVKNQLYRNGIPVVLSSEQKIEEKVEHFENGKVKNSGGFKAGKPVGVHREFSQQGEIIAAKTYSDSGMVESIGIVDEKGVKNGEWKNVFASGETKSTGKYVNNVKDGEWIFYFESGKVEQKGKFIKDKPHGTWLWFYESGQLWKQEIFRYGKFDGKFFELAENGDTIVSGEYLEGEKNGIWTFRIGDVKMVGEYKSDTKSGIWKHYFPNGQLKFEGNFFNDEADGEHIFYYENGKIEKKGKFISGLKTGEWEFFDEEGKIFVIIRYKDDEEIRVDGYKMPQE